MITIGGKAPGASIEVHDVQFIIAEQIEETYKILKENWYGLDFKLHLDSYKVIEQIPGYKVDITETPVNEESEPSLFFINVGGYDDTMMHEIHSYRLLAASDINSAKTSGLELYGGNMSQPHIDNISSVSSFKLLNKLYKGYIKLTPCDGESNMNPDWYGYRRIDIK